MGKVSGSPLVATPGSDYDNTIGYFDALIIGTRDKPITTLKDFTKQSINF